MSDLADKTNGGYVEGESLTPEELHAQYGIPPEEAGFYRDCIRIYPQGGTIIQEGDQEQALYLLRLGTIGVFKGSDSSLNDPLDKIDAVSIFGEMSMINNEPRSATVRAMTDQVLVYRIATPNIHTILTNPMWAELLISRLCRNLAQCVEHRVAISDQLQAVQSELEQLKAH